ncbi:MAG: PepSY domain-containing protein, partial [Emcibacter sp.]|nr:PepSY domain-containing protein [Emcibacter sp.]
MKLSFLVRKWHKWLFLIMGLQMFLWTLGGLYMVAISIDYIHGDHLVKQEEANILPLSLFSMNITDVLKRYPTATKIDTGGLLGKAVFEITTPNGSFLIDGQNGTKLSPLPKSTIQTIAENIYTGQGPISSTHLLIDNPPTEIQSRPLPLWQINFDDLTSPTLYISAINGKLITKRHDFWRYFDFLWMLHIMDYEKRSDVNNWLLRISAAVASLSVASGIWLLFYSFKPKRASLLPLFSRLRIYRLSHKWLALIIGFQIFIWAFSGLVMAILDHDEVQGTDRAQHNINHPLYSPTIAIKNMSTLDIGPNDQEISLHHLDDLRVYEVQGQSGIRLFNAISGERVLITKERAEVIAINDYAGNAKLTSTMMLSLPTSDTPRLQGKAWKIDFDDMRNTSLYVSSETGNVIARRNDAWRIFDFFRMLHFMDYFGQNNFN